MADSETAPARDAEARDEAHAGASALRKIVFVCYGAFDCNSAAHIAGFANGLAGAGYATAVCAAGGVPDAYHFGAPAFEFFTIEDLARDPEAVIGFDGKFEPKNTILVCWTPRENIRRVVAFLAERYALPYIVHLEDNEEHLADLAARASKRWRWRKKRQTDAVTDPAKLMGFLASARGLTLIEERLKEIVPPELPAIVLEPGLDLELFGRELPLNRRGTIRRAVGCSSETAMIVYPGNVHRANAEEVRSLYEAVALLRRRGRDVILVRVGSDHFAAATFLKDATSERGIVALGRVERPFLIDLLKSADMFVQPGRPGPFNDYRLPSKLPEFMAIGRPIVLPATNVGTRLRDGIDALLLHKGSPEEIAERVESLLDDPALAERLSANARAFAARHYDAATQTRKLESFLQRML
jgi:glycosyltransferase involved in cell wall biosynthesis